MINCNSSTENRFTPIYDFGYVAMNFGWVYPEDSGEYICRATNLYGSDETRGIIKTAGKPGIVYESQLPKGMASIDRIREMEAGWQRAPDMMETEQERFKPCFVTKPEEEVVGEGDMARFVCRVTGYPKPRVMWLLNGQTVINVSRGAMKGQETLDAREDLARQAKRHLNAIFPSSSREVDTSSSTTECGASTFPGVASRITARWR